MATNGNFYGLTCFGGTTGRGSIFEFNLSTAAFAAKYNFKPLDAGYEDGYNPYGSLFQASNGSLYGMTSEGGQMDDINNNESYGVFFEYNLATSTYNLKVDFDGTNGAQPTSGALIQPTIEYLPVAICKSTTLLLDASGHATLAPSAIDGGSTGTGIILSAGKTDFSCGDVGEQIVALIVTDHNGNSSTCSATVTVQGNSAACQGTPYFAYTILGIQEVKLGENNFVQTGNVGATATNGHVIIGKNGVVNPGYVKAKKITVHPSAEVPNKFYEPVVVTLPEMKINTSNTKNLKNLTVKNNTTVTKTDNYREVVIGENCNVTFSRGTIFGTIRIGKGSKVTFNADGTGTLNVGSIELEEGTNSRKTSLIFTSDMSVLVKDFVMVGKSSIVNPDEYTVAFYIGNSENGNEGHGSEFLVDGGKTLINASVYTPTGTIKVQGDEHKATEMNGTFIAYKIESKGEKIYWNSSAVPFKAGTISSDEGGITREIVAQVSDLLVFPNPASGPVTFKFTVEQSGMATIDIYSSTGQVVQRAWEGTVKGGECQIVTFENQLAKGMYFVRMQSGMEAKFSRLIVADR
jgi:hypothetical protein